MSSSWMAPVCRCALALLVAFVPVAALGQGATITVTSLADSGAGTLREALITANSDGVPTRIEFAPGLSGGTIALASNLASLWEGNTTIDGDLDADCDPEIAIDGSALPSGNPLSIDSAGNHVRGLAFFGFPGCGFGGDVWIHSPAATGNLVECNWIGLDLAGTAHPGHCFGVKIVDGASGNVIGPGNRITAMGGDGIRLEEYTNGGYPEFLALTPDLVTEISPVDLRDDCGAFHRQNGAVFYDLGGHPFTESFGLRLTGSVTITQEADYTFAFPGLDDHARLFVKDQTILDWPGGGTPPPAVKHLEVGTHLLRLDYQEGGGAATLLLTISGPQPAPLGTDLNTGGCTAGHVGLCGELFQLRVPVERNRFTRNAIWGNAGKGIHLGSFCGGTTTNDPGDLDLGPNTLLNTPVLASVAWTGTPDTYRVSGTAPAGALVELFIGEGAGDTHGEPKAYLGDATADGGGAFAIDFTAPQPVTVPRFTATATDGEGNTSEAALNLEFDNGVDHVTLGAGANGLPGATIEVPIHVRDLMRSPLGLDRGAGLRIQGLLFKVAWSPASAVSAAHFERSGLTAPLSGFENNTQSGNTASYVAAFEELSNPIPFNLGAAAPGDVVAKMVLTIAPAAAPGPVTLTLDPISSLSDQGGFVEETTGLGTLALTSSSFTVNSNAAKGLYAAPQSASSVLLTWTDPNLSETGFRVERSLDGQAWAPAGAAGANDTAFLDSTGLSPATLYSYRLVTLLPEDSHVSNLASAMTFPAVASRVCPTLLSPPRGWARFPSTAWNGTDWGVVWQGRDSALVDQIYFQRFGAASLAPIGSPVALTAAESPVFGARLRWNGTNFGVVWSDLLLAEPGAPRASTVFFALLAPDGSKVRGDLRLSTSEFQHPFDAALLPALTWDGTHWGYFNIEVVSPPMLDLVYRRLDADGDLVLGPVVVREPAAAHVSDIVASWNPATGEYGLAWFEIRDTTATGYFQRMDEATGALLGSPVTLDDYTSAVGTWHFDVIPDGTGWVVAWTDFNSVELWAETWLQRFDATGAPVAPPVRVSDNPPADAGDPTLMREPGGGLTLFVECDAPNEICRMRTDAAGTRIGGIDPISPHDARQTFVAYSDFADSGTDFLIAATDQTLGTLEITGFLVDASGGAADPPIALTSGHAPGTGIGTAPPGNFGIAPLGSGFVAVWTDAISGSNQVQARIWDGGGTSVATLAPLTSTSANGRPGMFALGDRFAVAWRQQGSNNLWFASYDAIGNPLLPETVISTTPGYRSGVAIGYSGEEIAVIWARNGANGFTFLRIGFDGVPHGGEVNVPAGTAGGPPARMQWVGSGWALLWRGPDGNLTYRLLAPDGSSLTANVPLTAVTQTDDPINNFDLLWTGLDLAFSWSENRSLDPPLEEIYFTRLNLDGSKVFPEVIVVSSPERDTALGLYWTPADSRFHLLHFLGQSVAGVREIEVQPDGTVLPGERFWTYNTSSLTSWNGVTLAQLLNMSGEAYFMTGACITGDPSAPPCPALSAASVGRKVRLSWGAVNDPESGIFRHHIYRDGLMLAELDASATLFDDGGFTVGTTHTYEVRALNGAFMESESCPALAYSTVRGDANGNGTLDVADVFYLINFFLAGGPPPRGDADANGSGGVTTADIFYLINFFFAGGPPPVWSGETKWVAAPPALAERPAIASSASLVNEEAAESKRPASQLGMGTAKARPGSSVTVPILLFDASGTPLGEDRAAEARLQALAMGVRVLPASAVTRVEIRRAGMLAGLSPLFESTPAALDGAGLVLTFDEASTPLSWSTPRIRLRNGGVLVAEVILTLADSAATTPGNRIELRFDPATTLLSNQAGTITESAANGWLRLLDGAVEVLP